MKSTPSPNAAATLTCTYTVSTISRPSRFTSSSAPGCGPDAVATAPVTTSAAQAGRPAHVTKRRSHRGPAAAASAAVVAPRLERHHDRQREHREREQEVRHHRERVQVERDRDRAHRDLRDRQEERRERRQSHSSREADHAARAEPGDERQREPDERDDAVPELHEGVESLLRVGPVAALRPVVAPEAGSGQPHEGARGDHEEERRAGGEREPQEPTRGERADACDRGDHYWSTTPAPASTEPMRVRLSPAASNVASRTALRSAGSETSRPPAVCGSYASASSAASALLSTCASA